MERLGFIRDKLDIKVLILFVLRRVPGFLSPGKLTDLVLADGGVDYFDYAACLAELQETGHIEMNDRGWFCITEKGKQNGGQLEGSLPYSVRVRAEKATEPIAAAMERENMILTDHEVQAAGGAVVHLHLSDAMGEMLGMSLLVPDEATAVKMEARFRTGAEAVYNAVIGLLTGE